MTGKPFSAASAGFSTDSSLPSMMTEDELALYFTVARECYRSRGAVVEIGPWLGGGTFQICRGLEASGHDWKLTVYDRFIWSDVGQRKYPEGGLQVGHSFLPRFEENLKPYRARITPIAAELKEIAARFPVPQDIELLFVDAPKSWSMLRAVLAHVGPHLLPGASIVLQDFLHIPSRQIVWLLMSIPQFEIVSTVEHGTAVCGTVSGPITNIATGVPGSAKELTVADLVRLWERVTRALPDTKMGELSAGVAMDLFMRKASDAAIEILDRGVVGKPWHSPIIESVRKLISFGNPKNRDALTRINDYLVSRQQRPAAAETAP